MPEEDRISLCDVGLSLAWVNDQGTSVSLLHSPCSLCSPYNRPINQRGGVEARNTTLFGKLADQEDGRLKSRDNQLIGVWMPVSFIAQRGGGDEEVK